MLYCYHRIPQDVEIMAFADSDICVPANWLNHLVFPLRKSKHGAATGYRWFVPQKNNLATIALACVNAKIAQLLGDSIFNLAWGGSMAIRVDTFREVGLDKIWPNTISDDASLTVAVKKAGKKSNLCPGLPCRFARKNIMERTLRIRQTPVSYYTLLRTGRLVVCDYSAACIQYSASGEQPHWLSTPRQFTTHIHPFSPQYRCCFLHASSVRAILRQKMAADNPEK